MGFIFNKVTTMGSHQEPITLGRTHSDFWGKKILYIYLRLANVPECLYCRRKVKFSSFNLKNGSIHFRMTYLKVTKMGTIICKH